jgi:hypothetical protein
MPYEDYRRRRDDYRDEEEYYRRRRRDSSQGISTSIPWPIRNTHSNTDFPRQPRQPQFIPVAVPGAFPQASPPQNPQYIPVPMPSPGRERSRSRSRRYSSEDERRAAVEEYKLQQAEEERHRQAAIAEFELHRKEEELAKKDAEKAAVEKWKQEKVEKEEKERRAWEAYEMKRKEAALKEKEEKKKVDEEVKERLEKALRKLDLNDDEIQRLAEGKKISSSQLIKAERNPVWSRVKRSEISTETLKFYDLEYYKDPNDSDWLIIKRDLSQKDIDLLYEHTRRNGRLKEKERPARIEDRAGRLAIVKPRSPSRNRSKSRERSKSRTRNVSGAEKLASGLLRFAA